MKSAKIVLLGAGSVFFGLNMFKDLFSSKELYGGIISLVDIDEGSLNKMYALAIKMNTISGAGFKIERTTDRRKALPGADFVINSIAINKNALWKYDFEIPKKYGIRHTLGENGGPGGLFFTMRTIPLVIDIARDMEELCPQAYFLNFSNPESRIILALNRYSKIKSLGLCHGIYGGRAEIAWLLEMNPEDINIWAAGLNHFQWFLRLNDKRTGTDIYPVLRERNLTRKGLYEEYNGKMTDMCVSRGLFKAFGYYPSCSDDHIGEYLPYGWEGGEEGFDFEWDRRFRENLDREFNDRVFGDKPMDDWFKPSGEKAVEVIKAILGNGKKILDSGIVYNKGAITNLSQDAAVEVPIMIDTGGVHPITVGDLPTQIARLLSVQVNVQQMSVEAAVEGSKELALQALLMDPVVNSINSAEALLDELWEINKPYIRRVNT